jgi:ubiquitin carboxyl-terminal hydrolase 34
MPARILTPSMAHALISILFNIKLWLNYRAVQQLFSPVRSTALGYMCTLSDADLRQQPSRQVRQKNAFDQTIN